MLAKASEKIWLCSFQPYTQQANKWATKEHVEERSLSNNKPQSKPCAAYKKVFTKYRRMYYYLNNFFNFLVP